ncbi:MAG: ribulose-phosphate 3-epimerase [Candidatus Nealsonbacteria bacterium]|nr:ribulose-phosphate 3-epimerase [Candidatus Nealsonbacteria bacterium]
MEVKIIPAIIAKSQKDLEEKINRVKDFVDRVQLDIMDGIFVPNESLNFNFKLPEINCQLEAHLMVDNPDGWVQKNWEKVDTILIPIESCEKPKEFIKFFKGKEKKIGFTLNPETPLEAVKDYLGEINQVLIMTVSPGFYGAKFLPETLEKVRELRKLKSEIDIEVDGGITPDTIKMAREAGANLFVSGSYIMNSQNPQKAIETLSHFRA